jgi:hypothetical protein
MDTSFEITAGPAALNPLPNSKLEPTFNEEVTDKLPPTLRDFDTVHEFFTETSEAMTVGPAEDRQLPRIAMSHTERDDPPLILPATEKLDPISPA